MAMYRDLIKEDIDKQNKKDGKKASNVDAVVSHLNNLRKRNWKIGVTIGSICGAGIAMFDHQVFWGLSIAYIISLLVDIRHDIGG